MRKWINRHPVATDMFFDLLAVGIAFLVVWLIVKDSF